jgi:hypothetical protein
MPLGFKGETPAPPFFGKKITQHQAVKNTACQGFGDALIFPRHLSGMIGVRFSSELYARIFFDSWHF